MIQRRTGDLSLRGYGMKIFTTKEEVLALDWHKNPGSLRGKKGVYMITRREDDSLVYIGQSSNVGQRLCPSTHPVYRRELHHVYVLFVENDAERKYNEARFIQLLHPPVNERAGIMKIDQEMRREYYDYVFGK
jgi:hypothetical protein